MKRILSLTALSLAAATCAAQSSVTVYGIADAGVTRVSGLKGGSLKMLSSGIMDGSRVGFRGNEDLGGGWRAIFTLENRTEIDTGGISNRPPSGSQLPDRLAQATALGLPAALQPVVTAVGSTIGASIGVNHQTNQFFDRQAFVGLVTPFGAVLAGRQYTPAYEIAATFDTLQTQSSLAFGQVASFPPTIEIRTSNALQYRIEAAGFSASAMAAAGEGSTSTGHLWGAMLMYKNPLFAAGVGYNERENELGNKALRSLVAGAYVNVGPGTISAEYVKVKDDQPSGLSTIAGSVASTIGAANALAVQNAFINGLRQDADAYHIGYRMVLGNVNTIYVAASRYNDKRPNNADTTSYGVAYSYAFSKRTDVNVVATHFNNSRLAQTAPGGAGYLGGVTASAGVDSNSFALGLRHRF